MGGGAVWCGAVWLAGLGRRRSRGGLRAAALRGQAVPGRLARVEAFRGSTPIGFQAMQLRGVFAGGIAAEAGVLAL